MKTTTNEMIEVMQAYAEGKEIQFKAHVDSDWGITGVPVWNWDDFDYRVKSEPKYRPFKDIDELVAFWEKHYHDKSRPKGTMPLIWVKRTSINQPALVMAFDYEHNKIITNLFCCDLTELYSSFTFLDDRPCGVEE